MREILSWMRIGKPIGVVEESSRVQTTEIEDPMNDPDKFMLEALVRVPGVLNGSGILPIGSTSGRFMVVDLDILNNPRGIRSWRDAILREGKD